jgi:hypothetical protein
LIHTLHAFGEHDLVDGTCEWEGEEREKNKMRNEEASAAGRQNVLNTYEPHSSFTLSRTCEELAAAEVHPLHAFGEHELVDGTCERESKKREKDKMRNEEARAADRRKLYLKSSVQGTSFLHSSCNSLSYQ